MAAGLGPAARYRRWLSVLRGQARLVIGTRSAVFAPVERLGLVIIVWDDGDDTLAEPRAPYPHAREVAMLRAHQLRCAAMLGGYARTAEAQALVATGWAHDLVAVRPVVRACAPRVVALGTGDMRRSATRRPDGAAAVVGPPCRSDGVAARYPGARPGAPSGICAFGSLRQECRTVARCRHCTGPLSLADRDVAGATCRWCGRIDLGVRCRRCGSDAIRSRGGGARRTAEELGRAFPGTVVVTSAGDAVHSGDRTRSDPRRRHPGRRTAGTRWLRCGAAAGQLGAAGSPGPPGRGGHPAPLDGRRRAGALPR